MNKQIDHKDTNDKIFKRILKLRTQKDKLQSMLVSLSKFITMYEEMGELYKGLMEQVKFTFTGNYC